MKNGLYDLPDKACSLYGDRGNDKFPVVDARINTVIEDGYGDDRDTCEKICAKTRSS